jgi:tyrosyl-tRNA synthetase
LADYHTILNNKLDGNIETIRQVAYEYFAPVMLLCLKIVGCVVDFSFESKLNNTYNNQQNLVPVQIVFAQNLYQETRNNHTYFEFDMQVAKNLTLSRVLKSVSIMGKEAGKEAEFGTLRYPVMQVADAFFMQAHLVHAGMDQRKCHVLMREVASKLTDDYCLRLGDAKHIKPIAIHHSLLLGLEKPVVAKDVRTVEFIKDGQLDYEATITSTVGLEGEKLIGHTQVPKSPQYPIPEEIIKKTQEEATDKFFEMSKMSKSKPNSAIFVDDTVDQILNKIKLAYCPLPKPGEETLEQIIKEQRWNPILDWLKNMIFPAGKTLNLVRPEKFGGDKVYSNYEQLELDYFEGKLHPMDLKNAVSKVLIDWFEPIRDYLTKNPKGGDILKELGK